MAATIFSLAPRGVMFKIVNPSVKNSNNNFFKSFFCDRKNHLVRYTKLTAGVDKTLKVTISTLDLSKRLTERFSSNTDAIAGLGAAYTGFKNARSVLGLFNVFQGSIPGIVSSVKLCHKLIQDIKKGKNETSLTASPLFYLEGEYSNPSQGYNQIAVGRKQQASQLLGSIFNIASGVTFVTTFAALRPIMFANQYGRFCSQSTIKELSLSADAIMCANHIATIGSSVCSLAFENAAYAQAKQAVASCEYRDPENSLNSIHRSEVVRHGLSLAEKILDLCCDMLKLIPACIKGVPGEVKAGLGILVAAIGIYKVWRAS